MRNLIKITLFITAAVLMQGCATHANFVKKYNTWIGKDINYLVTQIGYPDTTYLLPNTHKVYVYERSRVYSMPSMPMFGYGYYDNYGMFAYGNDIVQEKCKLFIETNKKGVIVKWGSRGNHCVSQ
jgi:hypothetical protein